MPNRHDHALGRTLVRQKRPAPMRSLNNSIISGSRGFLDSEKNSPPMIPRCYGFRNGDRLSANHRRKIGLSYSLSVAGRDRPSTIMLCRVPPGIGFKVIRVFSAAATNSGSFRDQRFLRCRRRSGSTLAFGYRFGKGGKLWAIVKKGRERIFSMLSKGA
jgi:hypothetical protein